MGEKLPSGRIDITARDRDGNFVVIELKVGSCPTGALEQVLGYSADLEEETGRLCRAVLVEASFSTSQRSAAKRAQDVHLVPDQLQPRQSSGHQRRPKSD
ncbi:MAG: endonuclease NucS domain-containing protein, partial [Chakrabartia sp.]